MNEFYFYSLWSLAAGASLPLATANNAILNSRSQYPNVQSFYTSLLGTLLGGICVFPFSLNSTEKWQAPTCWWSLLGGLCALPACGVLVAVPVLGIQVALLVVLCAHLFTTLILDEIDGRCQLAHSTRLIAVAVVLIGAALDSMHRQQSVDPELSGHEGSRSLLRGALTNLFYIAMAAIVGVGYTLQAKCNGRLAKDLGSPARATGVSALVNLVASIPILLLLSNYLGIWPVFLVGDWIQFVFAALQSAFYIGTISVVPDRMGYTFAFMAIQCGSLVVSSIVDAVGVLGVSVAFDAWRFAAINFVFAGLFLLSGDGSVEDSEESEKLSERTKLWTAKDVKVGSQRTT